MNAYETAELPPASPVAISWSHGVVQIRTEQVFGLDHDRQGKEFLERIFGLDEIRSVTADRSRGTIAIRPAADKADPLSLLRRLAGALHGSELGPSPPLPRGVRETHFSVHRHGSLLSTCEVLLDEPGLLRFRHETLRSDRTIARRSHLLLSTIPGVTRVTLSLWTATLTIRYDPSTSSSTRLIRLAEESLDGSGWWARTLAPPAPSRYALTYATIGVAALTDFVLPVLAPLSAIMLIGTNVRTFRAAFRQMMKRQLGLPVLYTIIVAATLVSGQFLASALMSWSFKFWRGRLHDKLAHERRRWLDECLPFPHLARLITADGIEVLVPTDRLRPGDRVVVGLNEPVPADGRVIDGEGIVDEQSVRGVGGASRRRRGDTLFAGSTVLAGDLRIEVAHTAGQTRASMIGQALVTATSPAPGTMSPTVRAGAFADRTVGPTLATAGLGLLVGDLVTVSAILRPDYSTGIGVAVPLETLRLAALCARRGIVIRSHDAFERLVQVNLIVVEDSPALRSQRLEVGEIQSSIPELVMLRCAASAFRHLADDRAAALAEACRERGCHLLDLPVVGFEGGVTVAHGDRRIRLRDAGTAVEGVPPLVVEIDGKTVGLIAFQWSKRSIASSALASLRASSTVSVVVISDRPTADLGPIASDLGADAALGGLSASQKVTFLRDCRARGLRTALISESRTDPRIFAEAHVATSMVTDLDLDRNQAAVLLLRPSLELFAELWEIARGHESEARVAQRFILLPNLLCVTGALLLGMGALGAVVVTNLGTLGLYSRAAESLRSLETHGPGNHLRKRMS